MGAGSREQLLVGDFAMILRTSLSVTAEKTFSEHVNAGVGKFNWCLERSGSSLRILHTLSVKNTAKRLPILLLMDAQGVSSHSFDVICL